MRRAPSSLIWVLIAFLIVSDSRPPSHVQPVLAASAPSSDQSGMAHIATLGDGSETWRYERATAAGARWNRFPMYWPDMETSDGVFDFSRFDQLVLRDQAGGVQSEAILMNTPVFHATGSAAVQAAADRMPGNSPNVADKTALLRYLRGQLDLSALDIDPQTTPPRGLDRPIFCRPGACAMTGTDTYVEGQGLAPNPDNKWGRFVFTTVARYRGMISHWEMWNEPDFTFFWKGSVADYARLLRIGYIAAKAANPDAQVLMGGMMYWEWTNTRGVAHAWLRAFVDEVDANFPDRTARGYFFDVIPWHVYSRATDVYDIPRQADQVLRARGITGKTHWVNESNAPACGEPPPYVSCADPNYRGSATIDEQASFVLQSHALGVAAGLERVFTFQFRDDGHGEAFGLVRNDGSNRPAYTSFQVAATYLSSATRVARATSSSVDRVTLWRPSSSPPSRVTVLWNRTGVATTATVAALGDTATLVEQDGSTSTITANSGNFDVPLDPATDNRSFTNNPQDYIIGGRTRLVVESLPPDTTPPTSTMVPIGPTAIGQVRVSWSGFDAGWGIASYDVEIDDVSAATGWLPYLAATTATSAVFVGSTGHTYRLRVRARDLAGNVEATHPDAGDVVVTFVAPSHRVLLPSLPQR